TNPVAPLAADCAVTERQAQLHPVPPWQNRLKKKALPGAGWKPAILLERRVGLEVFLSVHRLVCFIPPTSEERNQYAILAKCREENSASPEASTSEDRLLPPARAQGFGTSCGMTAYHKDNLARESRRRLTLPTTLVGCPVTRSFQTGAHPWL